MQISILTSASTTKTSKTGKPYQSLEVNYKDLGFGKVASKQLFSFGAQEEAYKALVNAKTGEVYTVEIIKNALGFNDWVKVTQAPPGTAEQTSVASSGFATQVPAKATQVKSTYETPDERAKKQVYIIRQSSLSNALTYFNGAEDLTVEQVLSVAQQFYNWVIQTPEGVVKNDVFSLPNDIEVD